MKRKTHVPHSSFLALTALLSSLCNLPNLPSTNMPQGKWFYVSRNVFNALCKLEKTHPPLATHYRLEGKSQGHFVCSLLGRPGCWVDSGNENSWLWQSHLLPDSPRTAMHPALGRGRHYWRMMGPSCSLAAPRCPPAAGACSYLPYLSLSAQPASAGGERWAPCCIFSLLSVCALYSLAGPQSPPGTFQITSVFDYICLEHLFMSICGIIKESPRSVLLCHAEMKWCQRVSTTSDPTSRAEPREVRRGATGRCKWVAGFYPPVPAHRPTVTSTQWHFIFKICLRFCVSRRDVVIISLFISCKSLLSKEWIKLGRWEEFVHLCVFPKYWLGNLMLAGPVLPTQV